MATNESLENVNAAISAIEGGAQEYSIGTRKIRRADLSVLYAERKRLEEKMESQQGGTFVAAFDRR